MAKQTAHEEWMRAQWLLKEAERAAGIEKALEELNDRNAFITKAQQHFDDERQIVFAIPDLALRLQVICANRRCHRLCRAKELQSLSDLQKRVTDNGERIRRKHLWEAVFIGICSVFTGEHFWDMTGAVAGAVVGALVGFDHIRRANDLAVANIEEARNEMPDRETFLNELGMDGIFSKAEETTGQPDPDDVLRNYPDWS